jgi:hypothetical protein
MCVWGIIKRILFCVPIHVFYILETMNDTPSSVIFERFLNLQALNMLLHALMNSESIFTAVY